MIAIMVVQAQLSVPGHYFFNLSEQQEQENLGLGSCYPHGTSETQENTVLSLNLHNLEVAESIFKSFAETVA